VGLTPIEAMASICSVTLMLPSSAHVEAPILPVRIKAVRMGPISTSMDLATIMPVTPVSPLSESWKKDCAESTMPMVMPVRQTKGRERTPISYKCAKMSFQRAGRVQMRERVSKSMVV